MKLWTVKAGKYGEQEQVCLSQGLITVGWNDLPDLKKYKTREELVADYQKVYQESSNVKSGINAGQLWRFANEIQQNDIVALPSKSQPIIHIGKVIGDYHFEKKHDLVVHSRPVKWLKSIPRVDFDQEADSSIMIGFQMNLKLNCH